MLKKIYYINTYLYPFKNQKTFLLFILDMQLYDEIVEEIYAILNS